MLPQIYWHTAAPEQLDTATWLGEGDFFRCFVAAGLVIRCAKHAEAAASLERELTMLSALGGRLPAPIPAPCAHGLMPATGLPVVAYPLLPGTILEPADLGPHATLPLAAAIGAFCRALHSIPLAEARAWGLPERDPRAMIPALIAKAHADLATDLAPEVLAYYAALADSYAADTSLPRYTPALLHGDLSPDHCLGDAERGTLGGVIDFGDSCIGDRWWEFVYILEDYSPAMLAACLDAYAPEAAPAAFGRVALYQQLNNLAYCLAMRQSGTAEEYADALGHLIYQAQEQRLV